MIKKFKSLNLFGGFYGVIFKVLCKAYLIQIRHRFLILIYNLSKDNYNKYLFSRFLIISINKRAFLKISYNFLFQPTKVSDLDRLKLQLAQMKNENELLRLQVTKAANQADVAEKKLEETLKVSLYVFNMYILKEAKHYICNIFF